MDFNPNEHLMQIKNKNGSNDYLPVQWRLVWFREACPDGSITTELVHLDLDRETEEEGYAWNQETRRSEKTIKRAQGIAIFRATVKDGKGGEACGTKSEKAASFPDFIEKAETGAIGRALAALGYGTQFAPELDEQPRIVDAPVERTRPAQTEPAPSTRDLHDLTKPGSYEQHHRNEPPTVQALQARCNDLCGAGAWQTMVHKALHIPISDGPILDRDMTIAYRQRTADYLDYVEQQKPAAKTA